MPRRKRLTKRALGSRLDGWLEAEGLLEPATAKAIKSTLAWQIAQTMKARRIGKARLAYELRTSGAAVDRLLDPSLTTLTLRTLIRVALALSMDLEIRLVDRPTAATLQHSDEAQGVAHKSRAGKAARRRR
jgi:hypothetical protein